MLSRLTFFILAIFSSSTLFSQQQIRTGNFIANNATVYPITGEVEFIQEADGSQSVNFKNDFATVQGIALEVFLSTDADYDEADDLKISTDPIGMSVAMGIAITGPRSFTVASDVDINAYDYVVVQCTSANILWGYAALTIIDGGNNQNSNTWTAVDVDEGVKPTIHLDNNDVPHIAFLHESTSSGFTKISTLEGSSFSTDLVSEGYFYGPLDLAFDSNNRAIVAYHDHDEGDGEFAIAKEMPSGAYNVEFIYSAAHDGWDNTIFIEDDGTEHYLSTDQSNGVEYAIFENGAWQVELVGIDQLSYRWALDMAVVNDIIYVVAFQSRTGNTMMAKKENGVWSTETITEGGRYPSLSVDESGDVLVAYYKRIDDDAGTGYVEVAHQESDGWEFSIIDTLTNHNSGTARDVVQLLRNRLGTYLAYSDSDVLKLATVIEDNWHIETVFDARAESMELRNQTSMAVDDGGFVHFATYRLDVTATGSGVIMYITNSLLPDDGMMEPQMVTKNISFDIVDGQGNDLPMADLVLTSGDGETTINQMAFDQFAIEALETSEDQIQVCVSLNTPAIDGLSSVDVVRGLRIVLGLVEPCPINLIAADVDESGSVSSVDLVQMINVLIGNTDSYTNNPSWVFMIDGDLQTCKSYSLATLPTSLDITGIKKGNIECVDTPINLQDNDKKSIHWKN